MERMMSKFENTVEFNLSESGVHPMTLGELLEMGGRSVDALLATEIDYPQANGAIPLRESIARLYDGATADNVLVTVGAAEANYLTIHTLIEAGDEVVIMRPNYMQVWGIAHNRGARIKDFHLREESDWAPDLAELEELVSDDTKLIAVCNPNNPTGRIMTTAEMDAIVAAAARVGAWILADEVYAGAGQCIRQGSGLRSDRSAQPWTKDARGDSAATKRDAQSEFEHRHAGARSPYSCHRKTRPT